MRTNHYLLTSLALIATIYGCGDSNPTRESSPTTDHQLAANLPGVPVGDVSQLMGAIKGNGGDAVVCFNNREIQEQVKRELGQANFPGTNPTNPFLRSEVMAAVDVVEVLDVYEFRLPSGFPSRVKETIPMDSSFDIMAPKLIERMKGQSDFGLRLERAFEDLPLDNWRQASGVVGIDDSEQPFFLPSECLLVQLAVRNANQVFYDVALWSRLSELSRTALVLHELVYKVGTEATPPHSNSQKTREVVGLLISMDQLTSMTSLDLYDKLSTFGNFGFEFEIEGKKAKVIKVFERFADRALKSLIVESLQVVIADRGWEIVSNPANVNEPNVTLGKDGQIMSIMGRPVGQSAKVHWSDVGLVTFEGDRRDRLNVQFKGEAFVMTTTGDWRNVKDMKLSGDALLQINGGGTRLTPLGETSFNGRVDLDEKSGEVMSATGHIEFRTQGRLMRAGSYLRVNGNQVKVNSSSSDYTGGDALFFSPYQDLLAEVVRPYESGAVNRFDSMTFDLEGSLVAAECTITHPCKLRVFGKSQDSNFEISGVQSIDLTDDDWFRVKTFIDGAFKNGPEPEHKAPNAWLRVSRDGKIRFE